MRVQNLHETLHPDFSQVVLKRHESLRLPPQFNRSISTRRQNEGGFETQRFYRCGNKEIHDGDLHLLFGDKIDQGNYNPHKKRAKVLKLSPNGKNARRDARLASNATPHAFSLYLSQSFVSFDV